MKSRRKLIIAGVVALCVTAFLAAANHVAMSVRMRTIRSALLDIDNKEGGVDHIALVVTYEIHKKMYEERLAQEKADAMELRMDTLVMGKRNEARAVPAYAGFEIPALWLINLNRRILGKGPLIIDTGEDAISMELDIAFYYERNFMFERAIEAYDTVLSRRTTQSAVRSSILLHQGYCYALLGKSKNAREKYQATIREFPQESSSITATILLKYMEGFTHARERVLAGRFDPLSRSRKLVHLMAYRQALEILENEEEVARPKDLALIRYSKARCYAGLGNPGRAAETYLKVVLDYPDSEYAKLSNRRLYSIGLRAGGDNEIRRIAVGMNGRLKDPVLTEMIMRDGIAPKAAPDAYRNLDLGITEKVSRLAEAFVNEGKKQVATPRSLIIETSDGNTFKGTVIEETSEYIALETSIGRINVKKDRIDRSIEMK